jgi:hypothetical protein
VRRTAVLLALPLALGACADEESSPPVVEPPPVEPVGSCDEQPIVTWETFGQGFLTTYCQGCHGSNAPDRKGAPETIVFDAFDDVVKWKGLILSAVTSDPPIMPPAGGPPEADRDLVGLWLTCFAEPPAP